ncbi:hypothetical protein ACQKWADRAFT_264259 [Trichoderma austrokoningii]
MHGFAHGSRDHLLNGRAQKRRTPSPIRLVGEPSLIANSDNLKRPEQAHASRSQDQKCPSLGRGKSPPQTCFIYPQLAAFVMPKSNFNTRITAAHKQPV